MVSVKFTLNFNIQRTIIKFQNAKTLFRDIRPYFFIALCRTVAGKLLEIKREATNTPRSSISTSQTVHVYTFGR